MSKKYILKKYKDLLVVFVYYREAAVLRILNIIFNKNETVFINMIRVFYCGNYVCKNRPASQVDLKNISKYSQTQNGGNS